MTQKQRTWWERVQEWRASGVSADQFAQERGFKGSTLRYWATRLKRMGATTRPEAGARTTGRSEGAPFRLVRVGQTGRRSGAGRSGGITVMMGGAQIEVQPGFDRDLLVAVIHALAGAR